MAACRVSRRAVLAAAPAVLAGCGVSGKNPDAGPGEGDATNTATPSRSRTAWGVFEPNGWTADRGGVVEALGAVPDYVQLFAAIGGAVPVDDLERIRGDGATAILTLEPWAPGAGVDQPEFSLTAIAAGACDTSFARWAEGLAGFGSSVLVRFAHEMNAPWYPWGVGVNGNEAGHYREAWERMRAGLSAAPDLTFVWSPNAPFDGQTAALADVFPGGDQVDVLGIDGYNWGGGDGHTWVEPAELFGTGLEQLRALHDDVPILVTETACAETTEESAAAGPGASRSKAEWITALGRLVEDEGLAGFVWFDAQKERDWRIRSTPEAAEAFRTVIS